MRLHAGVPPLSDEQRGGYRGQAGVDMHHGPAGEVQGPVAYVAKPAAAPDPVGDGRIYDADPDGHEDDISCELEPLNEGARDQGRRDDGEHHLEDDK